MIFLSSFRPFDRDPTGEYGPNQLAAFESWKITATKIVYFNSFEARLDSPKTIFVPSTTFPRILDMVEFAAAQSEWSALINADIVIGKNFHLVEAKLNARKAKCASSWRYNFDPSTGIASGVQDDQGLDFFAAAPEVWQRAFEMVDERLHFGAGFWDSWTLSLFCTFYQSHFWNLTPTRVINHPRHGGRAYGPGVHCDDIQTYGWPTMTAATIK